MAQELHRDAVQSYSDLAGGFAVNRGRTIKKRDFSRAVNKAMAVTDPEVVEEGMPFRYRTKEEKEEALDKVLYDRNFRSLDSGEVMQLFSAYRNLNLPDKMIEVFYRTSSREFKEAPMVREAVAIAFREKRPFRRNDWEKSMSMCMDLVEAGKATSASYYNLGMGLELMDEVTVGFFEQGFEKTLDPYLGLEVVRADLNRGNNDKAREMAKVVYLAALRDGAEESKDFYTVSAAFQAAYVAGESPEVLNHLGKRLVASLQFSHQWDEFEQSMRYFASFKKDERLIDAQLADIKKKQKEDAREGGVIAWNEKYEDVRSVGDNRKLEAVISYSYNYRGCGSDFRGTSCVGGNMAFGGQLPDHTVSKKDLELFSGLLEKTPNELGIKGLDEIKGVRPNRKLSEIKDPELFLAVTDKFVRQTFMTENFAGTGLHMEENALSKNKSGESVYDATVNAVLHACGKKGEKDSNIDTRTNISAIFALGIGDCRHHAQVKQIMFDVYQRKQMDEQIRKMYDRAKKGKTVDLHGKDAQQFYDVLDTELRTADVQVRMPVMMKQKVVAEWVETGKYDENGNPIKEEVVKKGADGKTATTDIPYKPMLDQQGRYKVDPKGRMHNLEDHTLCWMVKKDRKGNLKSFGMRDAFYQDKHYHWGKTDVDVDKIKVSARGAPLIPAGVVPAEYTDQNVALSIYQVPTSYNKGRRDVVEERSIGTEICLVGMTMDGFADTDAFLSQIKARDKMTAVMKKTLSRDPYKKTKDLDFTPTKVHAPKPKPKPNQKAPDLLEKIDRKQKWIDQKEMQRQQIQKALEERRSK